MASSSSDTKYALADDRARMWQAMRILKQFTVADLVATAQVEQALAYRYVSTLAGAEYLELVRKAKPGRGKTHGNLWKLLRDTGPFAPKGGKHQDPNLDPTRGGTHVSIPKSEYDRALACVRACAGMDDPESEVAALKILAEGSDR